MQLNLSLIRRDLHRHPEIAFQEHRTAGVIEGHLRNMGLEPRRVAGTGVVADIVGKKSSNVVCLRADIDALPIQEQSRVDFASVNPGVMHACGHDAHTAMLLGAARLLVNEAPQLNGAVRLIFQPAEETTQGAAAMIAAGVLQGAKAILGLHNVPHLPVGVAAFRSGPLMASSDRFTITVTGKGGHAAMPHETADPLVAAAHVLTGLQSVVSRMVDPLEPVVVSVGKMTGGTTFNVIPDSATLEGTVRCFQPALRQQLPVTIQQAAAHIAEAYRCHATLRYERMVPAVRNDEQLTVLARRTAAALLGAEHVTEAKPTLGAEDFALYQNEVPGCFFWLGSGGPHGWHHPEYQIDEAVLPLGAQLLAALAAAVLG